MKQPRATALAVVSVTAALGVPAAAHAAKVPTAE
ncbi:MAG: hypothetical protein AVDCRST_MAG69-989, partial [uncultured Solirubrobacteraceae bacterium]